MAIFKCKMCGGSLEVKQGASVIECAYCGTKQTLPKLEDERRANIYDRANHFRRANDFDKAMALYEQILTEDPSDAEAYWSIVLCRYGIEYVKDPVSGRRVPTVNRMQLTSVLADEDYKSALAHADGYQRGLYEAEAKEIDGIQRGILAISQKEEPFDVFICYKETDASGERTRDSVLANDLYYELTHEGFKVFFSRITLEDKLGTEYEPYIFAALQSAPVMVVLGTKAEHFNAPWVRNEWSRYLALIRGGAKKTLIPAYRDMDPYDLPDAFSHLQAQDMSKLGFMQDLVRGIKKLIRGEAPQKSADVKEEAAPFPLSGEFQYMKRAHIYIEDGDWESADEYTERALDVDPENANAYLLKLAVSLHLDSEEKLLQHCRSIADNPNYIKALRYSKGKRHEQIAAYETQIQKNIKDETRNRIVREALAYAERRNATEQELEGALKNLGTLRDCEQAEDARAKVQAALKRVRGENAARKEKEREQIYARAQAHMKNLKRYSDYESAVTLFSQLSGWRDADALRAQCERERAKIEKARKRRTWIIAGAILFLTVLAVIITCVAVSSYRKSAKAQLVYEKKYGEVMITGYKGYLSSKLEIPSVIDQCPVTDIGSGAFEGCKRLTSVTIPGSVVDIRSNAFADCTALKSVTIEDGVERIRDGAFSGCTKLTEAVIPDSVTEIGKNAFAACTSLTSVTIGSGVGSIGDEAFSGCSALTSVTIPDSVTDSGTYVFKDCTGMTAAVIGNAVTLIDSGMFEGCTALTSVSFGESVNEIGSNAFFNCGSLTEAILPDGVTGIGDSAFSGCIGLNRIVIPNSVKSIGKDVFAGCTAIRYAAMPAGAISSVPKISLQTAVIGGSGGIGDRAFYDCGALTSVTVENGVTSIGDHAFYYCMNLTSLTLPDGVTSIGDSAFYYCMNLTSVTLPDTVTSIGQDAFYGCASLTSVTIPKSVTYIGIGAFNNCFDLTSVTFEYTDGWYRYESDASGTSSYGEAVSVTDAAENATNMSFAYPQCYWKRS